MKKSLLAIIMLIAAPVLADPLAFNQGVSTSMNVPVTVNVVLNDLATTFPIDPTSVNIIGAPTHGTAVVNPVTGAITYSPNAFYIGEDVLAYTISDIEDNTSTGQVFILVSPISKPCPTLCTDICRADCCFDRVSACMCTADSFASFTQTSGLWTQINSHVTTTAGLFTFNFLQYNTPIDQTYEVLEVLIRFPVGQLLNQFVSGGLVTNWDGSTVNGQKAAYISFDNRTGTPQASKLAIGGINSTETIYLLPFQIVLGQYYTLRLVKDHQTTYAFVNDIYIGSSATGNVTGNYVGVWAFQATTDFKNLTSCSYTLPVTVSIPVETNPPVEV